MQKSLIIGLVLACTGTSLSAQNAVQLSRAVFVERFSADFGGNTIERATEFRKGETVVFVVEWQTAPTDSPFAVSSPIPKTLQYRGSSHDAQAVSVDGGRNWGTIGALTISDQYGLRLASPEDVTHLRWTISANTAANGNGQFTYSAIVR